MRDLSAGKTIVVSVAPTGEAADDRSDGVSISADGRYVEFPPMPTICYAKTTGEPATCTVRDMRLGTTVRVSVPDGGGWANGYSYGPSPRRTVNGLRSSPTPQTSHAAAGVQIRRPVFVRDLTKRRTCMVSVSDDEKPANRSVFGPLSMSRDGRVVAFSTLARRTWCPATTVKSTVTFVRVVDAATTEVVSVNTAGQHLFPSFAPSLSGDGRYVSFVTFANDPSVGDRTQGGDVYVRDRELGTTVLASVTTTSAATGEFEPYEAPSMSADGLRVASMTFASDVVEGDRNDEVEVFLRIREPLTSGTPAP